MSQNLPLLFVIYTDLEPDDIIFLLCMLAKVKTDSNNQYKLVFIVGEGNTKIKQLRLQKYLLSYNLSNLSSEILISYATDNYNRLDGYEVLTEKELSEYVNIDASKCNSDIDKLYSADIYNIQIVNRIKEFNSGTFVILKPLRCELQCHIINEFIANGNFNAYIYEGFNLRSALSIGGKFNENNHTLLLKFLKVFKNVYLLSNFVILQNNQHPTSYEISEHYKKTYEKEYNINIYINELMNKAENNIPIIKYLKKYILIWNLRMLKSLQYVITSNYKKNKIQISESINETINKINSIYTKSIDKLSDDDLYEGYKLIINLDKIMDKNVHITTHFNIYINIATNPKTQFCLADYHVYNAIFNPDVYIWKETIMEFEKNGHLCGTIKESNNKLNECNDHQIKVHRAVNIVSWEKMMENLILSLN